MFIDEEAKGSYSIAISGHVRPDGDCVGSCLGMALYLKKLLPGAVIDVFLEDFSETLRRNMLGVRADPSDFKPTVSQYDLFVCLDCEKERLGRRSRSSMRQENHQHRPPYLQSRKRHGQRRRPDGKLRIRGVAYDTMDPKKGRCRHRPGPLHRHGDGHGAVPFSNTSRHSMEIAGRLIDFGFDFPKIVQEVWFQNNYVQQQILGRALLESVLMLQGKLIFSVVTLS